MGARLGGRGDMPTYTMQYHI